MTITVDEIKNNTVLCVANSKRIGDDIFSFHCIADISYIFRYVFKDDSGLSKSFLLTKEMVENVFKDCTVNAIHRDILMSVVERFNQYDEIVISDLNEMMGLEAEAEPMMLVVTNKEMLYGAAMVFMYMPYVSYYISTHYGIRNFYILPSSVHECIIVPNKGEADTISVKDLKDLVKEVNGTPWLIDERSVLSDNVFYYSEKVGRIQVVEDDQNEDTVQG